MDNVRGDNEKQQSICCGQWKTTTATGQCTGEQQLDNVMKNNNWTIVVNKWTVILKTILSNKGNHAKPLETQSTTSLTLNLTTVYNSQQEFSESFRNNCFELCLLITLEPMSVLMMVYSWLWSRNVSKTACLVVYSWRLDEQKDNGTGQRTTKCGTRMETDYCGWIL